MSALYSLRSELEYSTQTQQGKSFVVVKDPLTHRYFRFSETQAAILELLRSPTDFDGLLNAVSTRLAGNVSQATLEGFLDSLEHKLLLETPQTREKLGELSERTPQERNLLYLRLWAFNSEKVFDWLLPRARWIFTPAFHLFAAVSIFAGFIITVTNTGQFVDDIFSLLNLYGFLLIWLVVICVITLHEFAHGLTCRYFGGKVRELGFMLIYFQPAFYCDISDSWMFTKRRDRLWVTFAGGYFQLVLWGMAAVIWRIAAENTFISKVALIVILFSGLQTLFNFNPLIKLDGYYMLSDYLEIPNLRAKALRAFRAWLEGSHDPLLKSDQRKTLLTYGSLSLTFSTLLLTVVYVNIYRLATSYFDFAGLTGFLLFSGFTLRRTAAEPVAGVRALVNRASLKKHRILWIAGALLVFMLLPWKLRIGADFDILPRQDAPVRAETAGTVEEVLVQEGDVVHEGQTVAYLYDFNKEQELGAVIGELETKQSQLALMEAGPRSEEIDRAQRLVDTKQTELTNVRRNIQERNQLEQQLESRRGALNLAQLEFEQAKELFEAELGARLDMERAAAELEIRQSEVNETLASIEILVEANDRQEDLKESELAEARSSLQLLLAGSRDEEIEQVRSEVAMLQARLMMMYSEQAKNQIIAPIKGTVVAPDVGQLLNQHLDPGAELFRIMDLETVTAELRVPELEMADVHMQSEITLKVRSYPSCDFEGTVDFIAPSAEIEDGDRIVRVRSDLQNQDPDCLLKPEMTGVAKIEADWRLVIQLMTRRLIRWIRTDLWDLLP